ncbi:hypothetical protein [Thalassotalea sp. G2M2-11]|uniref:hypothetical protein n=1 Tax=Thalassotalea sp. G2M2-11 TaxID=2787627 RepID=UPI0019D23A72|nr:hypothetical protein [Thalassotalea sp. G2M2-11]
MSENSYSRWTMVKSLLIFQIKLAFDALRDLLLSPVSFVCTLFDIFRQPSKEQSQFNQLMKLGQQTDIWLNLFAHQQPPIKSEHTAETNTKQSPLATINNHLSNNNADQLFDQIASMLKEEQARGKLTAATKNKIRQLLERTSSPEEVVDIEPSDKNAG